MPFKEIKELRQSGRLEEALQMARAEFEVEPNDIWSKRNLSWVYYEYLKLNSTADKFDVFVSWLRQVVLLELPENEKMLFDSLAYQVGKILFSLLREHPIPSAKIKELAELIRYFHFTRPSEGYSFLLKGFHKGLKEDSSYMDFIDWWGLENLSTQDFLKEKLANGMEIMALAEQVYIAYAKHLLPKSDIFGNTTFDRQRIEEFLPKLETITEKYPHFQYPSYFQAKLLLVLGDQENILSAFLPFARKKKNDFWVWEILAEIFPHEPDTQFACYCKALSLPTMEDFLVKLRQYFAELLIQREMYGEAKTEILKIIETRTKAEWKIPAIIENWTKESWYQQAEAFENNSALYLAHAPKAEEILFEDVPETYCIVEFVNSDKKMLNFISSESSYGFFKYDRFLKKVNIGDVLAIRIQDGSKGGLHKVLTCKHADNPSFKSNYLKEVTGTVRIKEGNAFGFLDDVFIHPSSVKKYKLENGQQYAGTALKTFDEKKGKWGWKLI